MAQMTQSQQAKADADDAKEDAKIEAAEAKAKAEAAPDPYKAEMHAILEGALGIIRTLVQVTPGAGNAPEQAIASLIERFHVLTASGKPPEA